MMQTKTKGKKRLIFDHYGAKEITEVAKVTQTTAGGKSKVKKEHTMDYMNGGALYKVDFKPKRILRMKNPALGVGAFLGGGQSIEKAGKSMMKKMGGKMIGKDKVLGYGCEVWDVMGVQQCIYKGVVLRIVSNIMGLKNSEVATQIDFNPTLNSKSFKLPDFPIYDAQGNNLDRSKLDAMDARQSAKDSKTANDAAKVMAAGIKALVASGANLNSGKDLTPEQERLMQKAVMHAMGGEKGILAKQKREILKDLKKIPQAKACFSQANSVTEANACEKKIDSEDPEHHTRWGRTEKAKLLKEIETFESAAPCIRAAQSFQALRKCMPR